MDNGKILVAEQDGIHIIKFLGDVRLTLCPTLDQYIDTIFENNYFKTILIDLTETIGIDSSALGMLAKLSIRMKRHKGFVPTLISVDESITRILLSMGFDRIFLLIRYLDKKIEVMQELPVSPSSELTLQKQSLEAHKTLMGMNSKNWQEFKFLVEVLEKQHLMTLK